MDTNEITIEDHGHVLAAATLRFDSEHRTVHADFHVEPGHLPVGTRARLVDAVLGQPPVVAGSQVSVTFPAGDAEVLDRLRARCDDLQTRAAGASCLATGVIAAR